MRWGVLFGRRATAFIELKPLRFGRAKAHPGVFEDRQELCSGTRQRHILPFHTEHRGLIMQQSHAALDQQFAEMLRGSAGSCIMVSHYRKRRGGMRKLTEDVEQSGFIVPAKRGNVVAGQEYGVRLHGYAGVDGFLQQ